MINILYKNVRKTVSDYLNEKRTKFLYTMCWLHKNTLFERDVVEASKI